VEGSVVPRNTRWSWRALLRGAGGDAEAALALLEDQPGLGAYEPEAGPYPADGRRGPGPADEVHRGPPEALPALLRLDVEADPRLAFGGWAVGDYLGCPRYGGFGVEPAGAWRGSGAIRPTHRRAVGEARAAETY
jgi:hypothetical protein